MATATAPKESKSVLEPTPNTLAVENGVLYDYYPIKLGERKGDYVGIVKLPPVIREGYVTFQKKLYKLELRDFLRSRLNVGKPFFTATTDNSGNSSTSPTASANSGTTANVEQTGKDSEQSRADSTFGVQINQAADVAWEDQIRALLFADDPEEEWSFETATQP